MEKQDLSPKEFGSVKVAVRPLKKQRSIARLFSSPKTSGSSPPPKPAPPATPFKTSASSPESPGTSSGKKTSLRNTRGAADLPSGQHKIPNPLETEKAKTVVHALETKEQSTELMTNGTTAQTKENNENGLVTPPIVGGKTEAQIVQRSVTFPMLPQRSSSLAAPSSFNTRTSSLAAPQSVNGRLRGASTSSPSHIHQPVPRRIAVPLIASDGYHPKQLQQNGIFGFEAEIDSVLEEDGYLSNLYHPLGLRHDSEEIRESFRSALTSNSSLCNTTSTGRSSVATNTTSIGGLILDSQRPVSKHASMTVDDAIDMYAAGFTDDVGVVEHGSSHWPLIQEENRQAVKVDAAINGEDHFGFQVLPPARPSSTRSNSSAAIMSGNALRSASPAPPELKPTSALRDQYGFLKASHYITNEQYDAWTTRYTSSQERRTQKWLSHMREHNLSTETPLQFPPRSAKTQRFIRKGIPPDWRGDAWFFYAGGDRLLFKHLNLFSTLVSRSHSELSSNDKDMIERDLHRTFPDNIRFKPELSSSQDPYLETPLLSSLRRVLQAFALYCPRIGYCQSLNFITGLLLLFLPEEKAFWMLHIITTDYLPGTHDVSLEGANVDLWVLMIAFKESMPNLWPKIGSVDGNTGPRDARLPTISLCTTSWFMSLFIGTLPVESVLRVWDILFYEGSRTLFRIALAIFKLGEQRIKAISDPMEIFQIVQALPRGMLDAGSLMEIAFRRGGVSQDWVEKRRRQRKKWYARARAQAVSGGAAGIIGSNQETLQANSSPVMEKANSVWKRAGQRIASAS